MNMNLLRTGVCIFCRRNHKTKSCDIITKPETRKEILFDDDDDDELFLWYG